MQSKIILIPLFRDMILTTDGSVTPVIYDLNAPKFRNALPYAASLTLYSLTVGENATNDVEWNVGFFSGFDRSREFAPVEKLVTSPATGINANGSVRHAPYNTLSKFNLESRLVVMAQNRSGASGQLSVVASAVLAIETVA